MREALRSVCAGTHPHRLCFLASCAKALGSYPKKLTIDTAYAGAPRTLSNWM